MLTDIQVNCEILNDADDTNKKQLCQMWRFPLKYEDASAADIQLFINNQIALLIHANIATMELQGISAAYNKQAQEIEKAIKAKQIQPKFKVVSDK